MSNLKPWAENWEVGRLLGSGGQGSAHLVRRRGEPAGSEFVLKTLNQQMDPERRKRMYREVASLRTLDAPGIPRLQETNAEDFEGAEPLFLVEEFIPGRTLAESVTPRPPVEQAISLFEKLLDTVEYCHGRGVLHRDIKPDNIVLRDGNFACPVLIDFGQSFNDDEDSSSATWTGQHLGNRFLALPELQSGTGHHRSSVSDITACCGILFFALTGEHPNVLQDEQGLPPHKRARVRARLNEIDQATLRRILPVFDVGFEPQLAGRWQTVAAVLTCIRNFGGSSIQANLDSLGRRLSTSQSWKNREAFMVSYKVVLKRVATIHKQLSDKLQPLGFNPFAGSSCHELAGPSALQAFGFHPQSQPKGVNFIVRCNLSPTGEFVVTVEESEFQRPRIEVFRTPIQIAASAPGIEEAVGKFMIEIIQDSYGV